MAFERQYDPPQDLGHRGSPGGLAPDVLARVEQQAEAALTRLYETDDFKAFEEFLDVTEAAVVAVANQVADELGYCLSMEQPVADVYASFLLDVSPRPKGVQHAITEARLRLMKIVSILIDEIAAVEIEPARGERAAQVVGERLPKPLQEVADDFTKIVHICTSRLDLLHRRVLRYRQALGREYEFIGKEFSMSADEARELALDAMELLDTSVTLATGSPS